MNMLTDDIVSRSPPTTSRIASAPHALRVLARLQDAVLLLVCLIIALADMACGTRAKAATLEWLSPYTQATGASGDGSVITYNYNFSGLTAGRILRNGVDSAAAPVPPQPPYNSPYSATNAVSQDGTTVVGITNWGGGPDSATVWTNGDPSYLLNEPVGAVNYGPANAVNADGSVVVGQVAVSNSPFRSVAALWETSGSSQIIGPLFTGNESSATGVSGDGAIVVGSGNRGVHLDGVGNVISVDHASLPFLWSDVHGIQELPVPFLADGSANAISANGTTVVGQAGPAAALWQIDPQAVLGPDGGAAPQFYSLGALPGDTFSVATSVSGDGSVVVGYSAGPGGNRAFLWTSQLGMVDLNLYLPTLGVDLTNGQLARANGISADGRTIVGYGSLSTGPGSGRGWIAVMPVPEPSTLTLLGAGGLGSLACLRRRRRCV